MVERADLAVVATVIADALYDVWGGDPNEPRRPPRAVTVFEVAEFLKGPSGPSRIAVIHETDSSACGLVFSPEVPYLLVFNIERENDPKPLHTGLCKVKTLDEPNWKEVE